MSSEVIFFSEVSHANDLKAKQMRSHTQILTVKQYKPLILKTSMVARIIDGEDKLKKHSRTSPEIQSNELQEKQT